MIIEETCHGLYLHRCVYVFLGQTGQLCVPRARHMCDGLMRKQFVCSIQSMFEGEKLNASVISSVMVQGNVEKWCHTHTLQTVNTSKAALHRVHGPVHPKLEAFFSCIAFLGIGANFISLGI